MACGDLRFLEGGTINSSTVVNSQLLNSNFVSGVVDASQITKSDFTEGKVANSEIVNSSILASDFDNGRIRDLNVIDAPSAKVIVDAIATLPKHELMQLAAALFSALTVPVGEQPETFNDGSISNVIVGNADVTLGAPEQWGQFGEYVVPMYRPGERP